MAHKWSFIRLYAGTDRISGEWECQNCRYRINQPHGIEPEFDKLVWVLEFPEDLLLSCEEVQVLDVQGI